MGYRVKRFSSTAQKILRTKSDIDVGKSVVEGLRKKRIEAKDKQLKFVNSKIYNTNYDSPQVNTSMDSTYKRLGRAENTKLSEKEFKRILKRMMGL